MKLVSVVIPTFNRKARLIRALKSVFKQTYKNIEIIIVDDGSIDGTKKEVLKYFDDYLEKIKYIKKSESSGAAVARNIGIKKSKGQIIAFLDSDDEWKVNHIENALGFISLYDLDGVFGWFDVIINESKIIKTNFEEYKTSNSPTDYVLNRTGDPRTSTFVMSKDKLKQVYFDESLKKHQDWDLFIRFAKKFKVKTITDRTVIIHVDDSDDIRMSSKNNINATEYFLSKHKLNASEKSLAFFYYRLSIELLKREDNPHAVKHYKSEMIKKGRIRFLSKYIILTILNSPLCNVNFIHRVYRRLKHGKQMIN